MTATDKSTRRTRSARRRDLKPLAYGWLALSLLWAGVIVVTGVPAWTLALWIATTLGPLTLLRSRIDTSSHERVDR